LTRAWDAFSWTTARSTSRCTRASGLASAANPLDTNVLTETVLAEKNKTRDNDTKMEKVVEQMDQLTKMENTVKSRLGEMNALSAKVAHLERELSKYDANAPSPPPPPPTALLRRHPLRHHPHRHRPHQ
jgi:type IV secretory pathway VirB10-like protein